MSSDDARTAIEMAVATWPDDVRERLLAAVASIEAVGQVPYDEPPVYSDDVLDLARTYADALRRGEADDDVSHLNDLPALSPDEAALLVTDLAASGRVKELCRTVHFTQPHRYPVAVLLRTASEQAPGEARSALVTAAAVTSAVRLLRGVEEAIGAGLSDATLAEVVAEVAAARSTQATTPYSWWLLIGGLEPMGTRAKPPDRFRGSRPDPDALPDETVFHGNDEQAVRKSYPLLDISGTKRPDVVVVDVPFQVTVGLQQRRDTRLVGTAALELVKGEAVELEVVLLHDPTSIEVEGIPRATISVTDLQPYPTVTLTCTARYGEELDAQRRLGIQLLRDGQVVAIAWRTIVAVDSPDRVAGAVVPERREVDLIDLGPLLGDEPPDLVISVCRADAGQQTFVWTAYAADADVQVPDLPSTTTLDGEVSEFATQIRRSIEFSGGATEDYLNLAGRAVQIGRSVPEGIQDAVRGVATAPGRPTAPAVLLLTEELVVPWELSAFTPRLTTPWGGQSPFLGAHVAVAMAAGRAQAAAPAPTHRPGAHGGRAHRRLHGCLRMEAAGERGRRGRGGRSPLHPDGADRGAQPSR